MQLSKLKSYIPLALCLLSLSGCGGQAERKIFTIMVNEGDPPCGVVYEIPVSPSQKIEINGKEGPVTIGGGEKKGDISLKGQFEIEKLIGLQKGRPIFIEMGDFNDGNGNGKWGYEIEFQYKEENLSLLAETVCFRGKER